MRKTYNRLSVLFLMLLGVLPQIALTAQSMDCGVDGSLWLWLLGAALCLWVCACFRRGLLIGIPASAALLYFASRCFEPNAVTQLDDLIDRFSGAYYTVFLYRGSEYEYLRAAEDHSFLLLLIAFLLMAYLSSALTSSGGRRFMCLLGSVPLPAACLAVNGRPSYAPVIALLLFWALVLAAGNYGENSGSGKTVFCLTLPVLLLLALLLLASHPEAYDYNESKLDLSEKLEWLDKYFDRWFTQSESDTGFGAPVTIEAEPEGDPDARDALIWESDAGGMDLTQAYDRQMLEKRFFSVRSDESGLLYLRAVSYGDYLGTGWSSAQEAPCSSLSFTAQALRSVGRERSLTIRMAEKLRYAIVPYYTALSDTDDAGIPGDRQPERLAYYSPAGSLDPLRCGAEEEAAYGSFAHTVYTRLPESTRSVMLSLAAQAGLDPASPALIDEVAAYIRGAGEYDIETPPYLSDDYAVCFLTQAHRGYCVHFATAAVAMYRALGVPARITEGFLVNAQRGRFVDVKGAQAHAWAEIYRDGLGWLPVEVTGRGGLDPLPEESADPFMTPTPGDAPAETAVPQIEFREEAENPAPLPVGVLQSPPEPERAQDGTAVRKALLTALCLALLLSALPVWRRICRAVWRRRMEAEDPNRAAVAIWKRSRCAARFGGSVPAEIENCAEKACFSAKGVTAEERDASRTLLDRQIAVLYPGLPLRKRLLFRCFLGLK